MKIFYSPSYIIATHSFETTRKSQWIAESLAAEPIGGIELVAPEPTSAAVLSRVHDAEYVDAVRNGNPHELAESQGFHWDATLWEMACASDGGVVAAAIDAIRTRRVSGSLSSGTDLASGKSLARRPNSSSIQIFRQVPDRPQLEITPENQPHGFGFGWDDYEFFVDTGIA